MVWKNFLSHYFTTSLQSHKGKPNNGSKRPHYSEVMHYNLNSTISYGANYIPLIKNEQTYIGDQNNNTLGEISLNKSKSRMYGSKYDKEMNQTFNDFYEKIDMTRFNRSYPLIEPLSYNQDIYVGQLSEISNTRKKDKKIVKSKKLFSKSFRYNKPQLKKDIKEIFNHSFVYNSFRHKNKEKTDELSKEESKNFNHDNNPHRLTITEYDINQKFNSNLYRYNNDESIAKTRNTNENNVVAKASTFTTNFSGKEIFDIFKYDKKLYDGNVYCNMMFDNTINCKDVIENLANKRTLIKTNPWVKYSKNSDKYLRQNYTISDKTEKKYHMWTSTLNSMVNKAKYKGINETFNMDLINSAYHPINMANHSNGDSGFYDDAYNNANLQFITLKQIENSANSQTSSISKFNSLDSFTNNFKISNHDDEIKNVLTDSYNSLKESGTYMDFNSCSYISSYYSNNSEDDESLSSICTHGSMKKQSLVIDNHNEHSDSAKDGSDQNLKLSEKLDYWQETNLELRDKLEHYRQKIDENKNYLRNKIGIKANVEVQQNHQNEFTPIKYFDTSILIYEIDPIIYI
ncbi:unnamed protein product [Gordionus sp. m RMFG-2023]|uniref:probable serine/threonine-protein kinase clkA n=1 Tax=Gordionus sp. m RMFG-2023 TaxID=3053472 RepID=UPI0030DDEA86